MYIYCIRIFNSTLDNFKQFIINIFKVYLLNAKSNIIKKTKEAINFFWKF